MLQPKNLLMKVWYHIKVFFNKPFFSDRRTLCGLWLLLPLIAGITKLMQCNNFLIFRGVFHHLIARLPLYVSYPAEYFDLNHYGPFFSLVIAPFAVVPIWVGLPAWLIGLSLFLYWAISTLPISNRKQIYIYWFCAHELLTALFMQQFNVAIAAVIILAFTLIEREKDFWAAFFILLGTFTKLYGIVGLAFFFFSKHKLKFTVSCFAWAAFMFLAPMLISSPDYVVSQYVAWFEELVLKNDGNNFALMQNISLLGMIRKISGCATYSNLWVIIPGLIIFFVPYFRLGQYKHLAFRETLLASVLIFVVLFSTGSESSTYIIAFVGVAVWYWAVPWKRSKWDIALMIFAFLITSMSPSDLFPRCIRENYIIPYALKALPVAVIWFQLWYEMLTRNYDEKSYPGVKSSMC